MSQRPNRFLAHIAALFLLLLSLGFLLSGCDSASENPKAPSAASTPSGEPASKPAAADFMTIDWPQLMPQEDLDALMNPPEYLDDIVDGSPDDQLSNSIADALDRVTGDPYQKALHSTDTIDRFDGKAIRLPGFVVPLEYDDEQVITAFFFVPYFGACIHVPPPPPNQMIYVRIAPGFTLENLYDAFWLEGILTVDTTENEMGTAAYSMQASRMYPYLDPEQEALLQQQ